MKLPSYRQMERSFQKLQDWQRNRRSIGQTKAVVALPPYGTLSHVKPVKLSGGAAEGASNKRKGGVISRKLVGW